MIKSSTVSAVAFAGCQIRKVKARLPEKNRDVAEIVSLKSYRRELDASASGFAKAQDELAPPDYMTDAIAIKEWNALVPLLAKRGLLEDGMKSLLAGYCIALSRSIRAEQVIEKEGRYYKTRSGNGSYMKRRHPAVHDAKEGWASVRKFATQLGLRAGPGPSRSTRASGHEFFK